MVDRKRGRQFFYEEQWFDLDECMSIVGNAWSRDCLANLRDCHNHIPTRKGRINHEDKDKSKVIKEKIMANKNGSDVSDELA